MHRRQFLQAGIGSSVAIIAGQAAGFGPLLRSAAAQGDEQRTVIVDALNLREGPGLDHGVVSVLAYGQIVSIISDVTWADGYGWVQVAVWSSNLSGWVAAEFIGGESGGSSFAPGADVHVATDLLNLRSGPGLGDSVIDVYPGGTAATVRDNAVLRDGYTWIPVEVSDGTQGWFAATYLAAGNGPIPSDRIQVTDGPLNVRSEPSLNGAGITSAPAGAYGTVEQPNLVDADGYSWVYVRLEDDPSVVGWMATAFLSYIDVG